MKSSVVLPSLGGKADLQPCVQPFGVRNAILESVAFGSRMAEYPGNELRVRSPHPLAAGGQMVRWWLCGTGMVPVRLSAAVPVTRRRSLQALIANPGDSLGRERPEADMPYGLI